MQIESTMSTSAGTGAAAPRLQRAGDLDELRELWDSLAEAAGHPFGTWEWVSAWWRYYGAGRELYTFLVRSDGGEPVAILPLYVAKRRPVRIARFLGYGDLHSPLCLPEHRAEAAAAITRVIGPGRGNCRLLLAEKLPGDQGWGEVLGGRLIATHADPVLHIDGATWEEFLAARSANFRKQAKYKANRLARDHEFSLDLCAGPEDLDRDLDDLIALHRSRWQKQTSGIFEGRRGEMQREIAAAMLDRGWLRLWVARIDGEPAAAYYGVRYAGSEWFFQSGRDPRFDSLSVGMVLLNHIVHEAFDDGVETFRFLAGDEPYKLRLADDDYLAETRLLGSGPIGWVAMVATRTVGSMPDSVRGRLMGASR